MVRELWLWAVSQLGRSRLAARVGTGVQPLQGENYTYSRILGHVQLLIRPHFHRVLNPSILPPYTPLPLWSQMRCREREFPAPTWDG